MKMTIKIKQMGVCVGMAALMMAGAWLNTACSSDEAIVDNKPVIGENTTPTETTVKFTATLAPKNDASGTRVITPGKDANNKDILNVAWKEGEEIAVRYESTSISGNSSVIAMVTHVDETTGVATIEAQDALVDPENGSVVTFVYPYTLATDDGKIDVDKLRNQHGNLTGPNGISTLYDAATGSGTLDVNAGKAVVSSKVTMKNEVCICKFKFNFEEGSSSSSTGGGETPSYTPITIDDGNGHTYTITSDRLDDSPGATGGYRGFRSTDEIYVAMLPIDKTKVKFKAKRKGSSDEYYVFTKSNVKLEAGKFYRNLSITLLKETKDLSDGSITATDGDVIYQSSNEATGNTITIPDGATVRLAGVNINAGGFAGILCQGNAHIILVGDNYVSGSAAIQAGPKNTKLTISGSGSLTAIGGDFAAGIGSGLNGPCGDIIINGGTINATGGTYGAGIGSGGNTCGNITISGGTVTATGGDKAAGIGSGEIGKCGNITITSDVRQVTATKGTGATYSIGKGNGGSCGTITIGGTLNAEGNPQGGTVYYDDGSFQNDGETYLSESPFTYKPTN